MSSKQQKANEIYESVVKWIDSVQNERVVVLDLQRKFNLDYATGKLLMDKLEMNHIVGPLSSMGHMIFKQI